MKKTGRPRKTSRRDDPAIRRAVMRSPTSSCLKIRANSLKNITDISISTVLRRLSKGFCLKSHKPAAKPRLTSAMKKKRLFFANKHLYWTVENGKQFYSLTNLQFITLQCRRGTFEDQNAQDSMQSTPSIQQNTPQAR